MTRMTLQQQIEAANARGVGQFHLVRDGSVEGTHRGYESTVALAKVRGGAVYNDSGECVAGPFQPMLFHTRDHQRDAENDTEGALAVMDRNARYLERQGHANATRRTREAIAAVRELVSAARDYADVIENAYDITQTAPAKRRLRDAIARVQGEG